VDGWDVELPAQDRVYVTNSDLYAMLYSVAAWNENPTVYTVEPVGPVDRSACARAPMLFPGAFAATCVRARIVKRELLPVGAVTFLRGELRRGVAARDLGVAGWRDGAPGVPLADELVYGRRAS